MITVTNLSIYPIKACGGISLSSARVVPGGLENDRRYMLIDSDGAFVTRRQEARLAKVALSAIDGGYRIFAEEGGDFDLRATPEPEDLSGRADSQVWRDTVSGQIHPEGSAWFSAFLGREVRLVYMEEQALRPVNPERSQPGDRVSFADGYPLLIASESSLADLNARLDTPIPMSRFRPNVVIEGSPAFDEDTWKEITLGALPCVVPKPCDRCVVTTIEEGTGAKGKEPMKTLAKFRRWNGAVWFAANVIPRATGTITLGDELVVSRIGAHPRDV